MNRYGLLLASALFVAACGANRSALEPDQVGQSDSGLASIFHTADPRAAPQLLTGVYSPEAFGCWTKKAFSVALRIPEQEMAQPALIAQLYIPDQEMASLKSITLSATVNGVAIEPETFVNAGTLYYVRPLPSGLLAGQTARVDFRLDKWMSAGTVEQRELGVVLVMVGIKDGPSTHL
jgi:hypothetical protein